MAPSTMIPMAMDSMLTAIHFIDWIKTPAYAYHYLPFLFLEFGI
jgi:hypothetical protein